MKAQVSSSHSWFSRLQRLIPVAALVWGASLGSTLACQLYEICGTTTSCQGQFGCGDDPPVASTACSCHYGYHACNNELTVHVNQEVTFGTDFCSPSPPDGWDFSGGVGNEGPGWGSVYWPEPGNYTVFAIYTSPDGQDSFSVGVIVVHVLPGGAPEPVVWYKMDATSCCGYGFDSSFSKSHPGKGSATSAPVAGKTGTALKFNPVNPTKNEFSADDAPDLDLLENMAGMAWIRPLGPHGVDGGTIFAHGGNYLFQVSPDNQFIDFRHDVGVASVHISVPGGIPTGSWTHIAFVRTYDMNCEYAVKIYLNGEFLEGQVLSYPSVPSSNHERLMVGNRQGPGTPFNTIDQFNGDIDEVKIFDHCLNPYEIRAEFLAADQPNPVMQFCNLNGITINDKAKGSPYPSELTVSGLPPLAKLDSVELRGLSHSYPGDVDVLLVGPGGQNAVIMSDVSDGTPVTGLNLMLSDGAPLLPGPLAPGPVGPLTSGAFDPRNVETLPADFFPLVTPQPLGASALASFDGANPNGVWKLLVLDDELRDTGSISGWCLNVNSTNLCTPPLVLGPVVKVTKSLKITWPGDDGVANVYHGEVPPLRGAFPQCHLALQPELPGQRGGPGARSATGSVGAAPGGLVLLPRQPRG
jgi:hypothetical protein